MKRNIWILLLGAIVLLLSCSEQHSIARRFVKQNRKTVVALYLPGRLVKQNLREDEMPEELENATLEEQIEYMEGQIKVVNKIDDDKFLDIVYNTMKRTLEDYGLKVQYWEGEDSTPDSVHWVINVPRIEVREINENQEFCGWVYTQRYCMDMPIDVVNVAAWFEFSNGLTNSLAFTEQNYVNETDVMFDVDYQSNKVYANTYVDTINIDGFYRFASLLGRLYAGYCYDFLLNDFIDKRSDEPTDTIYRFRYDPYERYFYKTQSDHLIEIK